MSDTRIQAAREHLAAYEALGRTLRAEVNQIARARTLIDTSPVVLLTFGHVARDTMNAPDRVFGDGRQIVLGNAKHIATVKAGQRDQMNDHCERASEIAYPGLKACLLMWLLEWEARVKRDLAAWEARDPVAEAAALPEPATTPAAPPAS